MPEEPELSLGNTVPLRFREMPIQQRKARVLVPRIHIRSYVQAGDLVG